jgi:hypothetical protein
VKDLNNKKQLKSPSTSDRRTVSVSTPGVTLRHSFDTAPQGKAMDYSIHEFSLFLANTTRQVSRHIQFIKLL